MLVHLNAVNMSTDLGNTHSDRRSRDPFGSVLGVFSRTSASYNHRHTRSSWIPAPIPPNHPRSHPWSLQGSCLIVVDTVCNTSWLELLRPSLELHDVLLNIWKSIGCLYKVRWIQIPKQRQLCSSKYGLERRLWHQSGDQTACWHKTSHCSSIVINTVIVTAGTFEP